MMVSVRVLALFAVVAGAGCAPQANNVEANGTEEANASEPTRPASPEMGAISAADIAAELADGAGCSLVRDGKNLLVAVDDDAIAKPNGTTLHFSLGNETGALGDGGDFTGNGITITVLPAEGQGQRIEAVLVKRARVTVTRADGAREEFVAEWQCAT